MEHPDQDSTSPNSQERDHRRDSDASSSVAPSVVRSNISRCSWEIQAIASLAAQQEEQRQQEIAELGHVRTWGDYDLSLPYWVTDPYLTGPVEDQPEEDLSLEKLSLEDQPKQKASYKSAFDPGAYPDPNEAAYQARRHMDLIRFGSGPEKGVGPFGDAELPFTSAQPSAPATSTTSAQRPSQLSSSTIPVRTAFLAARRPAFSSLDYFERLADQTLDETDFAFSEQTSPPLIRDLPLTLINTPRTLVNTRPTLAIRPRNLINRPTMPPVGIKRSHQTYTGLPCTIVIHAGAGFHSVQNEKYHLAVCSDAATKAMKILNAGGSATEAVEIAIKHLEDHEITNAGFGSNLTIDGAVECDATIVDHLGRSGACGAVPNIKNPISLAKTILETSSKTLTLRRVPPNFLVGEGAKRFALEHGVRTVTNEQLVSRNARDRYNKWRADLDKVTPASESGSISPPSASGYNTDASSEKLKLEIKLKPRKSLQRDHTSAIVNGLWNEGQPDSPTSETRSPLAGFSNTTALRSSGTVTPTTPTPSGPAKRAKMSTPVPNIKSGDSNSAADDLATLDGAHFSDLASLDSSYFMISPNASETENTDVKVDSPAANLDGADNLRVDFTELTAEPTRVDKDMIVDTIGAIAIDLNGNIAGGSSSGGIGIKHMGRTGPAALVGVGTAVIPFNEADEDFKTVATVTSGTGEHMATTMAAQKCADRLYQGTRRGENGLDQKEEDVSAILQSFVQKDFMDHPGVKNQASVRAIGVVAVECSVNGIYVHWAHNTESFALASMSSNDKQPLTVMSRLPENSTAGVNIGGRKVFVDEYTGDCGW